MNRWLDAERYRDPASCGPAAERCFGSVDCWLAAEDNSDPADCGAAAEDYFDPVDCGPAAEDYFGHVDCWPVVEQFQRRCVPVGTGAPEPIVLFPSPEACSGCRGGCETFGAPRIWKPTARDPP